MSTLLFNAMQKAINAYLALDPASNARLAKLNDAIISIELLPMHFVFQLAITHSGIQLYHGELLPANCKITGTPWQLLHVSLKKTDRNTFFADDVTIEGDASISRQIIELFDDIDIDWEEYLAACVGDKTAFHLGNTLRSMKTFIIHTKDRLQDDINEYLHEESQLFPAKEALADFYNDIDQLRMDTDRLEARIMQLKHQTEPS